MLMRLPSTSFPACAGRWVLLLMLLPLLWGCGSEQEERVIRLGHALDMAHPVHQAMVFMGEELEQRSGGRLRLEHPPIGLFLIDTLAELIIIGLQLALVVLLRQTFASLEIKKPFSRLNGDRLFYMGLIVMTLAVFAVLYKYLLAVFVIERLSMFRVVVSAYIDWYTLSFSLLGMMLLVIAQVFRFGAALQEDQELTI